MTRQRSVVLEELRKVKSHPTADELHAIVRRRLPRISLGTVYRNLEYLLAAGSISRLESSGSMRFDGDVSSHQHVRCVFCGRIADIAPVSIPGPGDDSVDSFAFIVGARVVFDGVCRQCAVREPQNRLQGGGMADTQDIWRCQTVNCGYMYDPDRGDRRHKIPAGTKFEDLPDDWRCPVCGAGKKAFRRLSDEQ